MKGKLIFSSLAWVVSSTIIIMMLSIVGYVSLEREQRGEEFPSEFPRDFARAFRVFIEFENGQVTILEDGINFLQEREAWLQILDPSGTEIYEIDRPIEAPTHYTVGQGVDAQMFADRIEGYTIFINATEDLSYVMGFSSSEVRKHPFVFNRELLFTFFGLVLIISVAVFSLMAFLFGTKLAKPIIQIIEGLHQLAQKNYTVRYKKKGMYASVFESLNHLSETLELSIKEKKKIEKMRTEWIANISHDLKTPLSSIKGYSEVIADLSYPIPHQDAAQYATIMLEKVAYMTELIEELRLNESLKGEQIPLLKTSSNLTQFLREIIIEILNHPHHSHRLIHYEIMDEMIEYEFDRKLLKRSLVNLIMNALVHNPADTEIWISLHKDQQIIIEIKDNGQGMNQEDLEQLFQRYYRGTNTINYQGSGLGMSIAKEVIEAHGGKIVVESQVNIGTVIKIFL